MLSFLTCPAISLLELSTLKADSAEENVCLSVCNTQSRFTSPSLISSLLRCWEGQMVIMKFSYLQFYRENSIVTSISEIEK